MPNTARGWRRIGIVLSVVWFLGFGVFLYIRALDDAVQPYVAALHNCDLIRELALESMPGVITDLEKKNKWVDQILENENKCKKDAALRSSTPPASVLLGWVLVADLLTIGLGWLIVWGCVAVVRWIRRGFAAAT
jgi:hypothetical protein